MIPGTFKFSIIRFLHKKSFSHFKEQLGNEGENQEHDTYLMLYKSSRLLNMDNSNKR